MLFGRPLSFERTTGHIRRHLLQVAVRFFNQRLASGFRRMEFHFQAFLLMARRAITLTVGLWHTGRLNGTIQGRMVWAVLRGQEGRCHGPCSGLAMVGGAPGFSKGGGVFSEGNGRDNLDSNSRIRRCASPQP
jgi:hypothetical protein